MKRIDWRAAIAVILSAAGVVTMLRVWRPWAASGSPEDETRRVAGQYDALADRYDPSMRVFDWLFVGQGRQWIGSRVRGDVLELAVGTGRNLPYYDQSVRLTGVDVSPGMLDVARARARQTGIDADLRVADAQSLPFPDASFDTVVSTLAMCTIPDYERAIAEAKRVLRPGGRFVLLDHVRSPNPLVRAVQQILNPLTVRFMSDHLLREPADVAKSQGFVIEELERSKLGVIAQVVVRKPS